MRFTPRDDYRAIRAYDVEVARYDVELSDNTSVYGTPPAARRLLSSLATLDLTKYPTTYSRPLREAIATYVGVNADEVMVGAGSDEVMSCAFRALAAPGARVAYMDPTFVMTPVFAQTNSVSPVSVPLTPTFDADADALLAVRAELTYLCAPNNPTGTPLTDVSRDRVLREATGVVLVDEAYAEFAGTNLAGMAPSTDGMLVFRTFSKAFGLAGARVGYAVGARPLIAELEKARGPYAVAAISEQLARTVLTDDLAWVRDRVAEVVDARDAFVVGLHHAGFSPLPSVANFVLVPFASAVAVQAALQRDGVLVRAFASLRGIGPALRITIGTRATMERVLEALIRCTRAVS
jgi:histidinol-phosphate aminotransferase